MVNKDKSNSFEGNEEEVAAIAMELVNGGCVFDWIVNSSDVPLPEPILRYFFLQMLQGVHHLHSQGFYHADLKLENMVMHVDYLSDKTLVGGVTVDAVVITLVAF